ncbi:gephyrin-like isoform X2 [Scylla paramamosain]|uniref:gephyrin-like isoform X2 n=1 Tax=Scylla paramamosain TaxID=85552 RepID=UPI0030835B15
MPRVVKVGVLTVSDRCSRGEAQDEGGANLKALVDGGMLFKGKVCKYSCVSDDLALIEEKLREWCEEEVHLILTTGGTGFAERDVTPEAVKKVIEKEAPGLTTCMLTESLKVTPLAMLSRPVCGMRGKTLIATLPGSRKGSEECLRFISPAIPHAVSLIMGWKDEVEATHNVLQSEGVKCGTTGGHHHHHHHPCGHHHHHHHHHHHQENGESKADVSHVSRRPRKSPYPMISVSQAVETVLSQAEQCMTENLSIKNALGFVLAEDIHAKDPLPPFPASIKDGYAVLAADGTGLRVVRGDSTAGCSPEMKTVTSGVCVRVEDTELTKEAEDGCTELEIKILKTPHAGQDIRPLGCDIRVGEKILSQGTLLGPSEMGLLATVGVTNVLVVRKPVVAVLSTGNELQEPGETLREGHIRDSNKTTIMSLLQQHSYPVLDAGIARDQPTALLKSLRSAFSHADILVTSGGVSMGERDVLRPVLLSDFEAQIHFAQVFMKPGKPTTFATCYYHNKKKLILGLPGNPVSAAVTSVLYLLPLCRTMSGRAVCENICIKAKLAETMQLDPRPEYHRAFLSWRPGGEVPLAYSTGNQLSSRLLSMASAQALLKLPPASSENKSLVEGSTVEVILLGM